jgi:hypothetical protein
MPRWLASILAPLPGTCDKFSHLGQFNFVVYLTNSFVLFIFRFGFLECTLWIGKVANLNRVLLDPY